MVDSCEVPLDVWLMKGQQLETAKDHAAKAEKGQLRSSSYTPSGSLPTLPLNNQYHSQ